MLPVSFHTYRARRRPSPCYPLAVCSARRETPAGFRLVVRQGNLWSIHVPQSESCYSPVAASKQTVAARVSRRGLQGERQMLYFH